MICLRCGNEHMKCTRNKLCTEETTLLLFNFKCKCGNTFYSNEYTEDEHDYTTSSLSEQIDI